MNSAQDHIEQAVLELTFAARARSTDQRISRLLSAFAEGHAAFLLAEDAGDDARAEAAAEIMADVENAARLMCRIARPDEPQALPNPSSDVTARAILRSIDRI